MKEKTIYALGFFDGVHLGHQALLLACRHLAHRKGCYAGVVSFTTHPDGLVSGKAPALINTIEDRNRLLCGYGMEKLLELPFDKKMMTTHWSDFLTQLIEQGAAGFVCGDDFRFGAGGSGTAEKLAAFCKSHDLPYAIVSQQELDGVRVSSTYIRQLLEQGDIAQANRFLGHPHVFSGKVITGQGLGHTINVPTANLVLPDELVVPKLGVYACKVWAAGGIYPAVINIGTRPTVDGKDVTVEAHLLDFEGDLYGKYLAIYFYEYLRPEQKFGSLEELQAEIQKNAAQTRKILENC